MGALSGFAGGRLIDRTLKRKWEHMTRILIVLLTLTAVLVTASTVSGCSNKMTWKEIKGITATAYYEGRIFVGADPVSKSKRSPTPERTYTEWLEENLAEATARADATVQAAVQATAHAEETVHCGYTDINCIDIPTRIPLPTHTPTPPPTPLEVPEVVEALADYDGLNDGLDGKERVLIKTHHRVIRSHFTPWFYDYEALMNGKPSGIGDNTQEGVYYEGVITDMINIQPRGYACGLIVALFGRPEDLVYISICQDWKSIHDNQKLYVGCFDPGARKRNAYTSDIKGLEVYERDYSGCGYIPSENDTIAISGIMYHSKFSKNIKEFKTIDGVQYPYINGAVQYLRRRMDHPAHIGYAGYVIDGKWYRNDKVQVGKYLNYYDENGDRWDSYRLF